MEKWKNYNSVVTSIVIGNIKITMGLLLGHLFPRSQKKNHCTFYWQSRVFVMHIQMFKMTNM
jgi:hypothetical protein